MNKRSIKRGQGKNSKLGKFMLISLGSVKMDLIAKANIRRFFPGNLASSLHNLKHNCESHMNVRIFN